MTNSAFIAFSVEAFSLGLAATLCSLLLMDSIKLNHIWRSELFLYSLISALICLSAYSGTWPQARTSALFGALIGAILGLLWLRKGVLYWDKWIHSVSAKSKLNPDKHSDIRKLQRGMKLPEHQYDPWKYFRPGSFFMGLDPQAQPYYLAQLPHAFYGGTTGSGKGNALQSLAAQSVMNDEAIIYFDPKDDKYGPHALYAACMRFNRSYQYINVGSNQPPQINILAGASQRDLAQLLQAGFMLTNKNTDGDHHRGNDRKAARHLAALIYENNLTLAEAFERVCDDEFYVQKASGFLEKLESVAQLKAINASTTEDVLYDFIRDGGAIYVQSGLDEEVERIAQRLILIRVSQIASARDRLNTEPRIVCVIADEVRFQMSRSLLNILSTGRDKALRAILAFQSMVDLQASESDIPPNVIEGIVLENTALKHIYRLEDPCTAMWLAEKSGQVLVRAESFETTRNLLLSERLTKSIMREERAFLLDSNETLTLPTGWGAMLHKGQVRRLLIRPLPCTLNKVALTISAHASQATSASATQLESFFSLDDKYDY